MYVVTFAWVGRSEDWEVTETFNSFMELLKCLTELWWLHGWKITLH